MPLIGSVSRSFRTCSAQQLILESLVYFIVSLPVRSGKGCFVFCFFLSGRCKSTEVRWCTHSSAAHVWVTLWSLSYRLWLCFIRNVCHLIASVEVCVNINRWCSGLCCCCRLRVADLVEIADPPLSFCCCCKACCTDGCLDRCLTGFSLVWRDLGWTPWLCFLLVTAVLWSWGFDIKTYKYICIFMCVYIYI